MLREFIYVNGENSGEIFIFYFNKFDSGFCFFLCVGEYICDWLFIVEYLNSK